MALVNTPYRLTGIITGWRLSLLCHHWLGQERIECRIEEPRIRCFARFARWFIGEKRDEEQRYGAALRHTLSIGLNATNTTGQATTVAIRDGELWT